MDWAATDTAGTETGNGSAEAQGNEIVISGQGAYDGRLNVRLSDNPPVHYMPSFAASFAFESAPDSGWKRTTKPTKPTRPRVQPSPTSPLPATVDCGTATFEWDSNATDVLITCTVINPNPFDVMVGFAWTVVPGTPPAIELVHNEADGNTPSLTAEANGTVDLTFSLVRNGPTEGMFPGLQGEGYIVSITCLDFGDNACDAMTEPMATTQGEITWTLGEMPVDNGGTNDVADDAEGAMTPVLVGIGIVIALIEGIVGVLYMRNSMGEDFFDDDDDEDYYEQAMAAPDQTPGAKSLNLDTSKSLDELKQSGKELPDDAPEGLASSPTLGSSADAFEFGATAEDAVSSKTMVAKRGTRKPRTTASPLTKTAPNGGKTSVWWYREEGWEDWAVWEE